MPRVTPRAMQLMLCELVLCGCGPAVLESGASDDAGLERVVAELQCPPLRACSVDLEVAFDVTSLEPLRELRMPIRSLSVHQTTALGSFDGLEELTELRALDVNDNSALADIGGLRNLATVELDLSFDRNDALTAISLPSLTSVGRLISMSGVNTCSFDAPNLESFGSCDVEEVQSCETLSCPE